MKALTATQRDLVEAHLKLAESAARCCFKATCFRFIEFEDVRSAALLGLVEAARRFDPSRGLAFATLAFPVINGFAIDAIRTGMRQQGYQRLRSAPGQKQVMTRTATRVEWPEHGNDETGTPTPWEPSAAAPEYEEALSVDKRISLALATARSSRMRFVLESLLRGKTGRQIAEAMDVSEGRVAQLKGQAVYDAQKMCCRT